MPNKQSFLEFVEKEYRNDPCLIFNQFIHDARRFFDELGVDFDKSCQKGNPPLIFQNEHIKAYVHGKKQDKGRIWFNTREVCGANLPALTINVFYPGSNTGAWCPYQELKRLYEINCGEVESQNQVVIDRKKFEEKRQNQQALLLKRKQDAAAKAQKDQELRQELYNKYCDLYKKSESANGDDVYSLRKQISAAFGDNLLNHVKYICQSVKLDQKNSRVITYENSFSPHLAVPIFADFNSQQIAGFQRIHASKKLQLAIEPGALSGGFFPIGNFQQALSDHNGKIYLVEGFATGVSSFLAAEAAGDYKNVCVLVCFSASGLKSVSQRLHNLIKNTPWIDPSKFEVLADNDNKESGNVGLSVALEIFEDFDFKVRFPRFKAPGYTDFNDLHVLSGIDEVANFLSKNNKEAILDVPKDPLHRSLLKLALCQEINKKEVLKSVLLAGKRQFPKISRDHLHRQIMQARPNLNPRQVMLDIDKISAKAIEEANKSRDFTHKMLNNPLVNYIKVQADKGRHGEVTLPAAALEIIEKTGGAIVLKAPMGSGKTEKIFAPLMIKNARASYWCHRRTLVADFHTRVNIKRLDSSHDSCEILHYEMVDQEILPYVTKLAGVINSFSKFLPLHRKTDVLCIDEASQVLNTLCHSSTVKSRVQVFDHLLSAVKTADTVVLADADANDACVSFLMQARPDEIITIIELETKAAKEDTTKKVFIAHSKAELVLDLVDRLEKNERVYLATDSDGVQLKKSIEIELSERSCQKEICLINAQTEAATGDFFVDPEAHINKYDLTIVSPTVSSGVSIKNSGDAISAVFGIFHGVVCPSDALQMLARVRNVKETRVFSSPPCKYKETDIAKIIANRIKLSQFNTEMVSGELIVRHTLSNFDRFSAEGEAIRNSSFNNWQQNFYLQLVKIGWSLEFSTDRENRDNEQYFLSLTKCAKEKVREERAKNIIDAPDLNAEDYKQLKLKHLKNPTDFFKLEKFNIQRSLGRRKIQGEDVYFILDHHGNSKIRQYEQLIDALDVNLCASKKFDQIQQSAGSTLFTRQHKTSNALFGMMVLERLGCKFNTQNGHISGLFDSDQLKKVFDEVKKDKRLCDLAQMLCMQDPNRARCATTFFKNFFSRYGLNFAYKKINGQNYRFICPRSANYMHNISLDRKRLTLQAVTNFVDFSRVKEKTDMSEPENPFCTARDAFLSSLLLNMNKKDKGKCILNFLREAKRNDYQLQIISDMTSIDQKTLVSKPEEDLLRMILKSAGLEGIVTEDGFKIDDSSFFKMKNLLSYDLPLVNEKITVESQIKNCTENVYLIVDSDLNCPNYGETLHNYIYNRRQVSPNCVINPRHERRLKHAIENQLLESGQHDKKFVLTLMSWIKADSERFQDAFLETRLDEIEGRTTHAKISSLIQDCHNGFINPEDEDRQVSVVGLGRLAG